MCSDCNENCIPDSCGVAAQISQDANTNGIPDECEGEGMMVEGEGVMPMMGGVEPAQSLWEIFYEWAWGRCWGPACQDPCDVQFAAMVAELQQGGLPVYWPPVEP